MRFETERLILRPWEERDAESLYEYAKHPDVGPIAGWPVHTDVQNSLEIIRSVLSAEETYAVCLKEDDIAIGSVGLIPPMQSHTRMEGNEIEVGYWIGVPFWGQGLIPEAVRRLLRHAFEDLNCTAVWCGYYDGNEKSRRCQEKCGFRYHHTEPDLPCPLMGDVRTEHFTRLPREEWERVCRSRKAVLYIHGQGGNASEAEHYASLFPGADVIGFDYLSSVPWEAAGEFRKKCDELFFRYSGVTLIANSIGAYFSLCALPDVPFEYCFFISPIADMEQVIRNMMLWANVTEKELEEQGEIMTDFGQPLSWRYLTWVRHNPIHWSTPSRILYGSEDIFQSEESIAAFSKRIGAELTVLEQGEHWFHTPEQMRFLDHWILSGYC